MEKDERQIENRIKARWARYLMREQQRRQGLLDSLRGAQILLVELEAIPLHERDTEWATQWNKLSENIQRVQRELKGMDSDERLR